VKKSASSAWPGKTRKTLPHNCESREKQKEGKKQGGKKEDQKKDQKGGPKKAKKGT
jgi:hypothetical protein